MSSSTAIVCAGCGWTAPPLEALPFRCPHGGDDVDHVLQRRLSGTPEIVDDPDPFIRYCRLTHAWHTAMQIGMSDDEFVALVRGIGVPFRETPLTFSPQLGVWVKDETHNVSGSHKARHLMGVMIWLRVAERIDPEVARRPLAIASCGNAALAAATIAHAAARPLDVFIPTDANPRVVQQLEALGARITRCPRVEGERGDPAYLRFREAVAAGALPFTCQGNENGLVVEGGETLGWELVAQLRAAEASVDRVSIQVGGGALASAVIAAFDDAMALGVIDRLPRFDTVQSESAHPLQRALARVAEHGGDMAYAAHHRSEFMWPWETAPHSVAHGILDDETYDWAAVVRGMMATGGEAIVAGEEELIAANRRAVAAGFDVDETGSAGYAGILKRPPQRGESIAVLFTGCRR